MFCKILNLWRSKIHPLSQDFQVSPQSSTFSYILARAIYNPFALRTYNSIRLILTSEHEFYGGEPLCLLGLSD